MKKYFPVVLIIFLHLGCGSGDVPVEKINEGGVGVIVNHLKPYRLKGEPAGLRLEEDVVIDLEDEAVSSLELYRMDTFAIDSAGNIYIMNHQAETNHIFKFSNTGDFIGSFGRHGQGPGEFSRPYYITVTAADEIFVSDPIGTKLTFFGTNGDLLREIETKANITIAHPLENGYFVIFGRLRPDFNERTLKYPLELCDGNFSPLKTLDEFQMENFRVTGRIQGTPPGFVLCFGGGMIFTGNEARGYEIHVHDSEGNLVRKIRKEFKPVPVKEDFKRKVLERQNPAVRDYVFFPEEFPPFRTIFADEQGRLFVVTFESGDEPGESLIDVFNPEGIFIARVSAAVSANPDTPMNSLVRDGRLYYIREKETGFRELVVEKIVSE